MGGSSNLSMQYIFLLLIVVATTTQAYMVGYQDRRNDGVHDPRKIRETQQSRYIKITKKKGFLFNSETIFIVSAVSANFSKVMNWVAHIPKETKNWWITIFFGCAKVPRTKWR